MNYFTMSEDKTKRSQHEIRSAADKILAFNYQWDFFVLQVLKLVEDGNEVSFEYLDDVAQQTDEAVILYQVKHSVQKGTSGKIIHLTDRDNDLWKTIFVWMQFIEEDSGRNWATYINKMHFILATNKTESNNIFISALQEYHQNNDISKFKRSIEKIRDKGKQDSEVTKIISQFLEADYLELFVGKIQINLNENELKDKIKSLVQNRFALHFSKVDEVFERLMGRMRMDADDTIRKGEKIIYDNSTIQKNYWSIISVGREKLVFKTDYPSYKGDPRDLLFVKQLFAVNDVTKDDLDDIAQYTKEWFQFHNNIKEKWDNHDVNEWDISELTTNMMTVWKREHKLAYKKKTVDSPQDELDEAAQSLIYKIRSEQLELAKTSLGATLSNGCFYYYSNNDVEIIQDLPIIGWHIDWENMFRHHEQNI